MFKSSGDRERERESLTFVFQGDFEGSARTLSSQFVAYAWVAVPNSSIFRATQALVYMDSYGSRSKAADGIEFIESPTPKTPENKVPCGINDLPGERPSALVTGE